MYVKKVLLGLGVAMVVLVGAGVAYGANNSSSETDEDESYKGSVSASGKILKPLMMAQTIQKTPIMGKR